MAPCLTLFRDPGPFDSAQESLDPGSGLVSILRVEIRVPSEPTAAPRTWFGASVGQNPTVPPSPPLPATNHFPTHPDPGYAKPMPRFPEDLPQTRQNAPLAAPTSKPKPHILRHPELVSGSIPRPALKPEGLALCCRPNPFPAGTASAARWTLKRVQGDEERTDRTFRLRSLDRVNYVNLAPPIAPLRTVSTMST